MEIFSVSTHFVLHEKFDNKVLVLILYHTNKVDDTVLVLNLHYTNKADDKVLGLVVMLGLVVCDGLVVKSLDSQSRGAMFKTTGWLQGRLSLLSFQSR